MIFCYYSFNSLVLFEFWIPALADGFSLGFSYLQDSPQHYLQGLPYLYQSFSDYTKSTNCN